MSIFPITWKLLPPRSQKPKLLPSKILLHLLQQWRSLCNWKSSTQQKIFTSGVACLTRRGLSGVSVSPTASRNSKATTTTTPTAGIPCSHAIFCLRHERTPQESVLPHCYTIQAFIQAYGSNIWPCNDKRKWVKVWGLEILPPVYEKRVERPPKERRKTPHEVHGSNGNKLSKHGIIIHCSHCLDTGHNIATCEKKKAGFPPVHKNKKNPTPCADPGWSETIEEQVITQVVF